MELITEEHVKEESHVGIWRNLLGHVRLDSNDILVSGQSVKDDNGMPEVLIRVGVPLSDSHGGTCTLPTHTMETSHYVQEISASI